MKKMYTLFLSLAVWSFALTQPGMRMDFEKYDPISTLVVPGKAVTKAKFPFIDVHNHQRNMDPGRLSELVAEMDKMKSRFFRE